MLMEKVVMMVSQMYTYPKLIKFCMLIFNAQFFVKQTSTKWFEKKKKRKYSVLSWKYMETIKLFIFAANSMFPVCIKILVA